MSTTLLLVVVIILVALAFDFINGFHDAANSIATVVSTRVLSPRTAVIWAAFFNFVAAIGMGTAVASTIGKGMVDAHYVTSAVILSGLLGAITWDLFTWWKGLPVSSSHALIGGYAGAAVARAAGMNGFRNAFDVIIPSGWTKTLLFIVLSPAIGLVLGFLLILAVYWLFRAETPRRVDVWFRRLQLFSAAVLSFSHGTNDAQKTMGIITMTLVTAGYLSSFHIPIWVIVAAYSAIGLGTLSGGWRIVHTMGTKITKLRPVGGFSAETASAVTILMATHFGIPVSTTHTITGAIVGVGSMQRLSAVRWGVAARIIWAWVLTIPAAAAVGSVVFLLIRAFFPSA